MPTKRAFGIGIMCLRPSCRPYRRPMSRLLSQGPKGGAANRSENSSDHNDIRDLELISQHVERVVVHADQVLVTLRSKAELDQSEAAVEAIFPPKLTIPFAQNHPPKTRKESRMRRQSMGPSIQERSTSHYKRLRVRAAGWMRSSLARLHRPTKSFLPKVSPSAMSTASCRSRFFPRRSFRRSPSAPPPPV
jgi:hypothetical protein